MRRFSISSVFTPEKDKPRLSFEIFPPKTPKDDLKDRLKELVCLAPEFISITCNAGGVINPHTQRLISSIQDICSDDIAAPHITCAGYTREEMHRVVSSYWEKNIRRLVVLSGDLIHGAETKDRYKYANELVEALMKIAPFDISIGTYPEGHPASSSLQEEIETLEKKQDAGAKRAITQYCFHIDKLLSFRDKARKHRIHLPIIPGIIVIKQFDRIIQFSKKCQADIPSWIHELMSDQETNPYLSVILASEQIRILHTEGFDQFHLYTLNHVPFTKAICYSLGYASNPC